MYLMGPKSPTPQTQQLFGYHLDQHLNLKHPLIQLPVLIDWVAIDMTLYGQWSGHTLDETIEQVSRSSLPK
jgi:hypothetical protein